VFENFNGTPLLAVRMLAMKRAEMSPTGPMTDLARRICGREPATEDKDSTAYTEQAGYARRQDARNG
jgi:3,5,6-trichloropyridin-2-ol/2,4,6-trichlorophenol monooxygenase